MAKTYCIAYQMLSLESKYTKLVPQFDYTNTVPVPSAAPASTHSTSKPYSP